MRVCFRNTYWQVNFQLYFQQNFLNNRNYFFCIRFCIKGKSM